MTEDEEFEDLERRLKEKMDTCKHRWEETEFGKTYWAPGTYQFTCKRCGKMGMIRLEMDHEQPTNSV